MSEELLGASRAVFRPDVYDDVIGAPPGRELSEPVDGIGAFAGPPFDPRDIAAHLAPWQIRRIAR
jgi:NitT/TauT family transport system ATP-binding protein